MPRLTPRQRLEVVRTASLRREDGRWRYPLLYVACIYGVTAQAVAQLCGARTGARRGRVEYKVEPQRQKRWRYYE